MPTLLEVKGRIGADSFYQVLVVDAEGLPAAQRAAAQFLDACGASLLAVDRSSTREVPAPPPAWPVHETRDGGVAASGRMFIMRRFADSAFREVASCSDAESNPGALFRAVESICMEDELLAVVMGVAVPGAQRVRCGVRRLYIVEARCLGSSPRVKDLFAEPKPGQFVFFVPISKRERIVRASGLLRGMRTLGAALVQVAQCVMEEGDFLCREESAPRWATALHASAASSPPKAGMP